VRNGRSRDRSTITEVAEKAGVSLGTVSRVINNRPDVDPELRRRVMEAARSLRYKKAERGRRPVRGALLITFVLSNREFLHPMHARMLQGAEEYCEEHGYFLVFKRFDYVPGIPVSKLKLPSMLRHHGIADCLILAGTNYANLIEATESAGVPYILYGNNLVCDAPHPGADMARADDDRGSIQAVQYLVRLGHRRICYIGDISRPWFASRYQGYLKVMQEAGLEPLAQTVQLSPDNFQTGLSSAEAMMQGLRPTAIFAGSDHLALGAWEYLRRSGMRVPQDCSLIGFDDIPDAQATNPPLTTVHNPFLEVGRELARLAIEKAKSPCELVPESVLPTELIMRGTTWPCLETQAAG
jgi:LacI family transcriptional regulator